ncbi:HTH domain-containing protein, partial [Acinetobacter baumannii]|nr:HTH domain-containing protein [Acinetobacter baumannii]
MTINTDVTIKELADKLGISKQAVRRYFDQLPPSLIPIKKGGTYRINSDAQAFIAKKVSRVDTNKNNVDTKLDTHVDTSQKEEIQLLQKEVIADKNEQISSLKKQVEQLHTLLDQQQQLTLQSNKQIDKLQLQLETKENSYSNNYEKDSIESQKQQLDQLKNELEHKEFENRQLKEIFEQM